MTLKFSTPSNVYNSSQSKLKPEDLIIFDSASQKEYEIICRNKPGRPDTSGLQLEIVYTDNMYRKIVEILSSAKIVKNIFLIRDFTTFSIWTSIKDFSKESRRALYEKELEVMRFFSSVEFHFDFHIAYPEDTKELLSSGIKIIYSRSK